MDELEGNKASKSFMLLEENGRCMDDLDRVSIDVEPAEFFRMKKECPGEIASFHVLPPVLGKSNDFGKVRVKLSIQRYEVRP